MLLPDPSLSAEIGGVWPDRVAAVREEVGQTAGRIAVAAMQGINRSGLRDVVATVRRSTANPKRFEVEAHRRGIRVEQLAAAASIGAIRERSEGGQRHSAG